MALIGIYCHCSNSQCISKRHSHKIRYRFQVTRYTSISVTRKTVGSSQTEKVGYEVMKDWRFSLSNSMEIGNKDATRLCSTFAKLHQRRLLQALLKSDTFSSHLIKKISTGSCREIGFI